MKRPSCLFLAGVLAVLLIIAVPHRSTTSQSKPEPEQIGIEPLHPVVIEPIRVPNGKVVVEPPKISTVTGDSIVVGVGTGKKAFYLPDYFTPEYFRKAKQLHIPARELWQMQQDYLQLVYGAKKVAK